jgi:3-hydroxyisobutyrate dehydrogenase
VFDAAKAIFDKALADGWGDLDIACVHDQISGATLSQQGAL